MPDCYDLSGRLVVAVDTALEAGDRRALAAALDPFARREDGDPGAGVVVESLPGVPELADVHGEAGDATTTATDGADLYLGAGDAWCRLPDPAADGPLRIGLGPGFGAARAIRPVLRPALQLALARGGFACVHSAAVEFDGGAILVAGWSETGKTEGALAFAERGHPFFSDKWTVLGADGVATAFPISVGVRRWVLPALPALRDALPRRARAQRAAAAALDTLAAPAERRARGQVTALAAGAARRAVSLADRAALSLSEVRAAYGDTSDPARRLALRGVVLLRTIPGGEPAAARVDGDWAAARLARSAAYERRPWFALRDRARFADPARGDDDAPAVWIAHDEAVMRTAFARVPVVGVDVPFPADPRGIVAAALPLLG